jgi:hypothetical protein
MLLACLSAPLEPRQTAWDPAPRAASPRPLLQREACEQRSELRSAYFGDLHVHTSFSMDVGVGDLVASPDDAYRFASGEPLTLLAPDENGRGGLSVRLERALDFAAVTDHAEWLAETSLCRRPGSPAHDTRGCRIFRGEEASGRSGAQGLGARMLGIISVQGGRPEEICGPGDAWCRGEISSVWQATQDAAERWYDRTSACRFTTFNAWEYSATPARSKVHRNVILRNEIVPELPVSWLDEPEAVGLWRQLRKLCIESGSGCDALAIPHNPNLSNGRTFSVTYRDRPLAEQKAIASLRSELEPLVEMMQVKGESECRNGMFGVVGAVDELCDFEKIRGLSPGPPDCGEGFGSGATAGQGCVSRVDYARYALLEGLREQGRIGVNPYRLGFIGSTDTHNATPGDVEEYSYVGNDSAEEDAPAAARLSLTPVFAGAAQIQRNPGGLMGVWAEENTRDALFDAMQRRETFATSGPRITARLFGGWDYSDALCEASDIVARGYAAGVPMGGELPARPAGSVAPVFVASAMRDPGIPGAPGNLLQRLQIIKGWVDEVGRFHQVVHDVAGEASGGADVDLETCTPRGPGADALCSVWRDPDFDPAQAAVYYARIVENPSCRWHTRLCLAYAPERRPPGCDAEILPRLIQERAWTSPIWFTPAGTA